MNTAFNTNIIENLSGEYVRSLQKERTILTEEEAERTGYPIGHTIKYTPSPESPEQAFERLKKCSAQMISESLQRDFVHTYPVIRSNIESELTHLENFIKGAEDRAKDGISVRKAFSISSNKTLQVSDNWLDIKNDEQLEYIRLVRGYYILNMCDVAWNSKEGFVYGKYFLFRQWLIRQLAAVEPEESLASRLKVVIQQTQNQPITQNSLALYYYYCHEKKCLPPFIAGQMELSYKVATAQYGLAWKPFQQSYNRFSKNRNDRLAVENRAALKAAIQMLKDYPEALGLAKDELNTAETRNPLT